MSCGCPNCLSPKSVFGRSGPIGVATPYADGTNLFQRICFSPPFVTETQNAVECVDTYATQAGCVYNAECGPGSTCENAVCTPRYVGPQDIFAQNPRVIDSFAMDDPRLAGYIPAPFNSSPKDVQAFLRATCPTGGGALLTECAGGGGTTSLVCPYFPGHVKERNCSNCLRNLEKCDMFRGFLTDQDYQRCKQKEQCFQYDIALPNGTIHPVGYKLTPECVAFAQSSLEACAQDCSLQERAYM